jgi:hypothetical protein
MIPRAVKYEGVSESKQRRRIRIYHHLIALVILFILSSLFILQVSGEDDVVTSKVHCKTTKGDIKLDIYRDWSPLGADRFIDLVEDGFFQDISFFRCVKGFLTQCKYHHHELTRVICSLLFNF